MTQASNVLIFEKATVTGTSVVTLSGTVASGYYSFSSAYTSGQITPYFIVDTVTNAFEYGQGTYTTGTLTRTTVQGGSNGTSAYSFAGNLCNVYVAQAGPIFASAGTISAGRVPGLNTNGVLDTSFLSAILVSPAFTGTPTVPTASPGTNTTQAASTAFVTAAISGSVAGVSSFNTRTGAITLSSSDVTTALSYTPVNPTALAAYAPLASPTFTGTVTIPSGAAISGYLTSATAASTYAPLASPTFTGTPLAPTASGTTSTTQVATTAFVAINYQPNGVTGANIFVPTGSTAVTLTAAQSGVTVYTDNLSASVAINLPTNAAGLNYTIYGSGIYTFTITATSGNLLRADGTMASTYTLGLGQANGIYLIADGTNWRIETTASGYFNNLVAAGTVSGAGFTSLLAPYLTTTSAASTYAPLSGATLTGTISITGAVTVGSGGTIIVPTNGVTSTSTKAANSTYVANAFASPPVGVGSNSPNTGAFTTLSASSTVSGAGFAAYLNSRASYQSGNKNPTAPASTSYTMQGLSGAITPAVTGRVIITISGTITAPTGTTVDNGIKYQISYGTGTAPSNAGTLTGTQVGPVQQYTSAVAPTAAADVNVPFSITVVVNLTVSTAYWIDLAAESVTTVSQMSLSNVQITAVEI